MMNEKYYCGVDIGSQKIKAGILKVKNGSDVELIGVYDQKTYGFKNYAVSDLAEFSECVHRAVYELTQRAGVRLKDVHLGLSGAMVETRQTDTAIPLVDRGGKVIARRDIKKVNDHARLLGIKMEEELLHDLPQSYKVDGVNSSLNPLGLYGRNLGVHSMMIIVDGNRVRNITKAVHEAGFDASNIFLTSYAASQVILSDADRAEGCVLIDIGAKHTSVLVFHKGVLQYLEGIDIGGDDFTQHIAGRISLSFDLAEEIKKSYAVASGLDRYQAEEILVKKEEAYIPIKRDIINQAIQPDIDGLVGRIDAAVTKSGLKSQITGGMRMVGGGSLLPGLIERISQSVQLPAKLGQMSLPLRKNLSHTAIFSSVVGLAQGGFKKAARRSFTGDDQGPWLKHFTGRIKELYQEYF